MIKKLSIIFLTLLSTVASAEWVLLPRTIVMGSETTVYVRKDSISRYGDSHRYWVLINRPFEYRSFRAFQEANCQYKKLRNLSLESFAGLNAHGVITSSDSSTGHWTYAAPGTINESIVEYVCNRR